MVDEKKIPEGYKVTEVGIIPSEWDNKYFNDICTINQGLQIAIEKRKLRYTPNAKKYITIQYLSGGKRTEYIIEYNQAVCCDKNDILMTRTGNTGMVITGVTGVFHNNFFKINYNTRRIYKNYLVYYLKSKRIQKMILDRAGTSTIPDLNHNDFYTLPVVIPKIEEQQAIATAISDIDDLILSLQKLIDKKKLMKQGAMQELLTGKKRLEGFSEEWRYSCLSNIANITMGQSPDSAYYNEDNYGMPLIQGNADIKNRKTIIRFFTSQVTKKGSRGDIIMTVRAPVGKVAKAQFDCCIGRGVCAISYHNNFLYHYLIYIEESWSKLSKGSTFDSVNSEEIKSIVVPIPINEEQEAIATILTDMDKEIEKLQIKLDKYKQIKKGMMEELLSGKRRLV